MHDYSQIRVRLDGAISTVILSRPDKLNCLTDRMNQELAQALAQIAARPDVRLVVLEGAGRAFCAGYDVAQGEDRPAPTPAYWRHHFELGYRTLHQVWSQPQPVVAKVRGPCLGGGFALAMACDLVYAADDACFGDPEIRFGDGGHLFPVLQWAVGMKRLNELQLTGRFVKAAEAQAWGIVNEVLPPAELDDRVQRVTAHMCLLPEGTLAANKAANRRMYESMGLPALTAAARDRCILSLSTREETEFSRRAKAQGVRAALQWQKQRFADIGAF